MLHHGRAAFVFVFITVLLDMLALGISVPVLPKLIILETAVASRNRHPVCPIREIRDGAAILLPVFRKQNIFIELQPRPGFRSPPHLSPKPSPTIEFRTERALTIQVTDGFHATVGGYGS